MAKVSKVPKVRMQSARVREVRHAVVLSVVKVVWWGHHRDLSQSKSTVGNRASGYFIVMKMQQPAIASRFCDWPCGTLFGLLRAVPTVWKTS